MATSFNIVNATIPVGSPYDATKFILGDVIGTSIQLVPKLTQADIDILSAQSNLSVRYKVYNVTTKQLWMWDGSNWTVVNDGVSGFLAANTTSGQTVIKVSDTAAPTAGQLLTATSATTAIWADSAIVNASQVVFSPTGDVAATNVQTAIAELDTEKLNHAAVMIRVSLGV